MIDALTQVPESGGDAAIPIAPLMVGEDALNLLLYLLLLIRCLQDLLLIVEGATRQTGKLEQARQRKVLP